MWIYLFSFLFLYSAIFLLRYYMRNDKIMCPVVPSAYWICGFFGVRTLALIILLLANAYTRRRQIIWWLVHAHSRTRHYFVSLYEHEILMWAALQHEPLKNIVSLKKNWTAYAFVSWSIWQCVRSTWESKPAARSNGSWNGLHRVAKNEKINIWKDNKQLSTYATSVQFE